MAPLENERVSDIEILSLTKPKAQKTFQCAWGHGNNAHSVAKGNIYVRVVWKLKGQDKVNSDHICVDCWSK